MTDYLDFDLACSKGRSASSANSSGIAAAMLIAFADTSGSARLDRSSRVLPHLADGFDYCSCQSLLLASSASLLDRTGFAD